MTALSPTFREFGIIRLSHYEALMRIIDVDGTVYAPAFFMDTAKKYHLYSYLSERMYERVFSLFAERGESVSLNFSAYDINSQKMQQLIFEQLEKAAHPEHFWRMNLSAMWKHSAASSIKSVNTAFRSRLMTSAPGIPISCS